MKASLLFLTILIAALAGGVTAYVVSPKHDAGPTVTAKGETVYDRIIRTGTLRCAYADYPPLTIIDPNTKAISGVYYDLIEDIGHRLNLKVEWVEEVGYGNINEGFNAGRYDLFCSPLWPSAARAKVSLFSLPLYFSPVFTWVRPDDARFDNDLSKLNNPTYTVTMIDGDVTQAIADKDFPLAKHLSASQSNSVTEEMENVTTGKADATSNELNTVQQFLLHNPGALKNARPDKPIRVYANTIMFPAGEYALKSMIDTVIGELYADGSIDETLQKYLGDHPPFFPAYNPKN